MKKRKGLVLAGGTGTRLYPLTLAISKQLMPIYDKPMIYYPLSTLMLSGIRDIGIITTPEDHGQFKKLLGNGSQWGLSLTYLVQEKPDGLAQAYIVGEDFLEGSPSAMVLGDNIYFGHGLQAMLLRAEQRKDASTVFGYYVSDPQRYGVLAFDQQGRVQNIVEKPKTPPSNYAVTGLYFLDGEAPCRAKEIKRSDRGEYEIVDLLESYLADGKLKVELMGRGYAWLDTGTHAGLLDASNFARTLSQRQGLQFGCPEEIALKRGWITENELLTRARMFKKSSYGEYLLGLLELKSPIY